MSKQSNSSRILSGENFKSSREIADAIANTIANAEAADMVVSVPSVAIEWAESVYEQFLAEVAAFVRDEKLPNPLLDRGLFDPSDMDSIEWNQGLTSEFISPTPEEIDYANTIGDWDEMIESFFGPLGDMRCITSANFFNVNNKDPNPYLDEQYNRFFPLKIVMRVAASLLKNRERYKMAGQTDGDEEFAPITLEDLRSEAVKVVAYAKERMERHDRTLGTEFGQWFSVGMTDGSKKQNERFSANFVGSVRNPEKGMPYELGFISIEEGEISLTDIGVDFVLATNPLIDTMDGWKENRSLSEQEVRIILKAMQRNIPKELELMQRIVKSIGEKSVSPSELDEIIRFIYRGDSKHAPTMSGRTKEEIDMPKKLSLLRSGVCARMLELGLIDRKKTGRNVFFSVRKTNEDSQK